MPDNEDQVEKRPESDEEAAERRARDYAAHHEAMMEGVADAHDRFPTPSGVKFEDMSDVEKQNFASKQNLLKNTEGTGVHQEFARLARETFLRHQAEDPSTAIINAGRSRARAAEQRVADRRTGRRVAR